MRRIVAARIVRYLGALLPLALAHANASADETSVGLGVSLVYGSAFLAGALLCWSIPSAAAPSAVTDGSAEGPAR